MKTELKTNVEYLFPRPPPGAQRHRGERARPGGAGGDRGYRRRQLKELMIEFYRGAQSGKMNRCQALRQAALRQMAVVKQRYGYPHPFYWGAFVFMGEP